MKTNGEPIYYLSCKMHRTKRTPAVDPKDVAALIAMWGPKKNAPRKYSSPDVCLMAFRGVLKTEAVTLAKSIWPDATEFEFGRMQDGTRTVEFGCALAADGGKAGPQ